MSLLSTRFRAGNRPDALSIPDSCFAEIELKIKKFRGFEKFKLSSAIKADLTDLLQRYSFARYMAGGAINACEAADAIKSLMEGAAGARAAAKEFFGRPHYLLFESILVRHGMPDLDSFRVLPT